MCRKLGGATAPAPRAGPSSPALPEESTRRSRPPVKAQRARADGHRLLCAPRSCSPPPADRPCPAAELSLVSSRSGGPGASFTQKESQKDKGEGTRAETSLASLGKPLTGTSSYKVILIGIYPSCSGFLVKCISVE